MKVDGTVGIWGNANWGGCSSGVQQQLRGGIEHIYSTDSAFAAVKLDGTLLTWGKASMGGDSSGVREQLRVGIEHI